MNKEFLKNLTTTIISLIMLSGAFAMPLISSAALPGITCGVIKSDDPNKSAKWDNCLIPCNGVDLSKPTGNGPGKQEDCDFNSLMLLIKNVMYYLIYIAIPVAALAFAYAGWLFLSAGGNSGKVTQAWSIFRKVGTGLIVILAAWLFVKLVVDALVDPKVITSPLQ